MVGHNEANKYLPEVLERLKSQVDEIVFTDDCSEDNTAEVASEYATVYKSPVRLKNKEILQPKPMFTTNEGRLRKQAWLNLENHATEGDWIIAIDCDEMLYDASDVTKTDIRQILNSSEKDVVNVRFYHMWNDTQYRVDKLWAPNPSSRIFRFMSGAMFRNKALACGSEPTYVTDLINQRNYFVNSNLIMQHLGYIKDEDKQSKYERYSTLDGGEFHALNHINSIVDPNPVLINWGNFGI